MRTSPVLKDSALRCLAEEIASLDAKTAKENGLLDFTGTESYPANYLVNGSDAAFAPIPTTHGELDCLTLYDLAKWKFNSTEAFNFKASRYGFNDESRKFGGSRGLSLLFDPLVDAFLVINPTAPKRAFVVVLTDYYPFSLCYSDMSTKADWSLKQTSDYLEGKVRDATLDRILQGISLEKFKDYGVYIWNLHPFFRGGGEHSSNIGLPKDAAWLAMAWKWLSAFTKEVDAHTVVLACSGEVLPQHKDSNNCQNDLRKEGQFCWNWKRQEADTIEKEFFLSLQCSHIFRMHHPSSWNRQKKKDGQKRMAEIFRGLLDGWHAETMECRPSHAPW